MSASQTKQTTIVALSEAITKVTTRLRRRADAAQDFEQLTGRAQAIATAARDIQTSRWGIVENSAKLANDLARFAGDVAAASARAVQEAESSIVTVATLNTQAARLKALGVGDPEAGGDGGLGSALRELQATLEDVQGRMTRASGASEDAALLASRAGDLADCAKGLKGGGREMEEVAARLNKALTAFAEAAISISERLSNAPAASDGTMARAAFQAIETELVAVQASGRSGQIGMAGWHGRRR